MVLEGRCAGEWSCGFSPPSHGVLRRAPFRRRRGGGRGADGLWGTCTGGSDLWFQPAFARCASARHHFVDDEMVEAAGVEPACQANKPAATTCLVRVNCRQPGITPTRNWPLSQHGISRQTTRCPRCSPSRQIAFAPPRRGQRANVAD